MNEREMYNEKETLYLNGLPLEQQFDYWANYKMQLSTQHNDFDIDKYPNSNQLIVDNIVENKALIEMTNPKETTFMPDKIMLNKIDYFIRKDPLHLLTWFIVVSFANFSQYVKDKLKQLNIHLIVLGIHADQTTKFQISNALSKTKLADFFTTMLTKVSNSSITVNYSNTVSTVNQLTNNQLNNITNNHLHQHSNLDNSVQEEEFYWRNGVKISKCAIDCLS